MKLINNNNVLKTDSNPDFYLMMLYFFNPETGSIKYTSTAFLPIATGDDDVIYMRMPLVFPCGLIATPNSLYISYGEGDAKSRLMRLKGGPLRNMIINTIKIILKTLGFSIF